MRVLSTSTLIASLWLAVPRTFALSIDITSDGTCPAYSQLAVSIFESEDKHSVLFILTCYTIVSIAAAARGAADGLMSFYVGMLSLTYFQSYNTNHSFR